jgi:hypothetical protein
MKQKCLFGVVVPLVVLITAPLAAAGLDGSAGFPPGTAGPYDTTRALGDIPCICGFDPAGAAFCSTEVLCPGLLPCADNLECVPGFQCLVGSCCTETGSGVCVPVCDDVECINPGVCESFEECEAPLYVVLSSLEARWENGAVHLSWTTAAEIDNAGFQLLRVRGDGARVRKSSAGPRELAASLELVTHRLIPAQGDALNGASYRFADGAPQRPGKVSYYLVDVDYAGAATLHGPVHVEIPRRSEGPERGRRSR